MERKTLYIIRHAEAESSETDFSRNLSEYGRQETVKIAHSLKNTIPIVDEKTLVLSSTATRASETAKIFCDILDYPEERIRWESTIYEGSPSVILKLINTVPSHFEKVLVFGHNPGLSLFIRYISGGMVNLKTSAIGCLSIDDGIDYSILSADTAVLTAIIDS